MLASGVTTADHDRAPPIDMEYRDAIERGEVAGPRLLVSGPGLSPPGGHGCVGPGVAGVEHCAPPCASGRAQTRDHIKVFMTGGVSPERRADGLPVQPGRDRRHRG